MGTDYTTAITAVVALVLVLTCMTTYVLSRTRSLLPIEQRGTELTADRS